MNTAIRYSGILLILFTLAALFFLSETAHDTRASGTREPKGGRTAGIPAAPAVTITNPAPIVINDADIASPYPSTITVSGAAGIISAVKVTLNGFSHTFPDDVGIVLVGPTGAALLLQDGAGDDPDIVNVTYRFVDGSPVLPGATAWTAGDFKPTTYFTGDAFPAPGPGTTYGNPGPAGSGTATLASTFNGTAPNGNWNLYVVDFVAGDEGTISGGWSIEITTIGDPPFNRVIDFNGDGKTDWAIVRNTGGGQMTWMIQENSGAAPVTYQPFGLMNSDYPLPEDYDGDGKTDIAVWRDPGAPGPQGAFYILQSQGNTVRAELFGLTGDDATVVGDYDGDGKTDLAVVRRSGGLMYWYYRTAPGGPVFTRQWGLDIDFAAPGDFDGDGKGDFAIQRDAGMTAIFFFNYSSAAPGTSSRIAYFGKPSDLIVPGDYDGDGKTDIAVARNVGGALNWYYEPSTAPGTFVGIQWGIAASDFPTQGDYDGDGKTDLAVWRSNNDPTQNFFLVRKSSDGSLLSNEWGIGTDYPVANYNTH